MGRLREERRSFDVASVFSKAKTDSCSSVNFFYNSVMGVVSHDKFEIEKSLSRGDWINSDSYDFCVERKAGFNFQRKMAVLRGTHSCTGIQGYLLQYNFDYKRV